MPKVKEINNRSYMSVKECIANFLNSGKVPKTRVGSNHIRERIKCATQSKVVGLIYAKAAIVNAGIQKNDLLILLGLQWIDNFNPYS